MAPRITHTSLPRASTNPHQRFARARAHHLASPRGYPVEDFQRHWNEQMGLTSATQLIYWMAGYEISKPSQAMADEVNQCLTPLFNLDLRRRPPQVPPLDENAFRPHVVFFWEVLHQYSQMLQSERSLESVFGLLEWYRRYGLVQENGVVGLREMMWLRTDWERGAVLVDALRGLRVPMIAVSQKDWLVYVPRDEAEMCRMLWETLPHQDQAKLKPHLKRRRNGGKKSRKWWA